MKDMIIIIFSVLLSAVAQMLLKQGMTKVGRVSSIASAPRMLFAALTNPIVLSGLAVFALSALSWLVALSRVKLSVAYPMVSMGYVVVILFSWLVLREAIRPITLAGCFVIIIGVFLISRGMN